MYFPKQDVVKFLIKEILKEGGIHSQEELAEILNKKLKSVDKDYTISGRRARKIAALMPEVKVRVHTRHGEKPKKCPVCGGEVYEVYMKNLKGEKILFEIKCKTCSYTGKNGKWIPKRYEFWIEE
ncbi:hypothetical protein DRJ04_08930 [Candidatus Aerophobetes bacterium]|uniref:Uncharacterized protein n=1 Tax=Aerophobetes bacterium TaxID=2030807 RepID=A0A662D7R4_UNCAE|nr:MAG: hypothetical protein DRJ04_08930 [Candidatus Aerophobetes bacterium]